MHNDEDETPDDNGFELADDEEMSPEQLAELNAALEEADRGEGIPAEEMLRQMRELRKSWTP